MIRTITKRLLSLLPHPLDLRVTEILRSLRSARHREGRRAIFRALHELGHPTTVLTGPFRGMRCIAEPGAQGGLIPKILGTYERELHAVMERVLAWSPSLIIDVGAADGYYAVGLAVALPSARIIAFEMDKPLRGAIAVLAHANEVEDRVDIRGQCDPGLLEAALIAAGGSFSILICDVEGYEEVLLDPAAVPSLRKTSILCEVHDALRPGVGAVLRERFGVSHALEVVESRDRSNADVPPGFSLLDPVSVLHEGRTSRMEWLLMVPRASS